jgi:toxin ParE1/3/4
MRELRIKPRARLDLLEIWLYIAKDSVPTAIRIGDEIEAAIRGLSEMPGKGHLRTDVKDPRVRFWSVYSYIIAYRFDQAKITILRVVHGRRDFRKLFRKKL